MNSNFIYLHLFMLLNFANFNNCARILGVITTPSYSHQEVFQPLWRELSLRGHQVTVLTTDPMKDSTLTNLTEVDLHFMYDEWRTGKIKLHNELKKGIFNSIGLFVSSMCSFVDAELQHPEVQKIIKNETEHFDLVIMEYFLSITTAFGHRFNCPVIAMTSADSVNHLYEILGSWSHPVLTPESIFNFDENPTFFQRLGSSLFGFVRPFLYRYYRSSLQDVVYKNFGTDYPLIGDLEKNISMAFINTNPINSLRPLVPSIIQIGGGIHLRKPESLPQKLQTFLDGASDGFIYFSLGTNAKSIDLSKDSMKALLGAFSILPYKVLWKFEADNIEGLPHNVVIAKWLPQQDILRHPNIKLFITQGGWQSLEEALYNKVPILGMPIYADQFYNIKLSVKQGLGLSIDYKSFTKLELLNKILEVAENPKYRNRATTLAELALDQPMTGLEKAVWWTEYVLRHKGAQHLKSAALNIPAYQYYLLDVISVCIIITLVVFYIILKSLQLFLWLIK